MRKRTALVWGVAIVCFVVLMLVTPAIPQSQEYHDFADQREFFGIPNALNVISNFPFFVVGLIGLVLCYYKNYFKLSIQGELCGWTVFFVGVAAVAFGSAYYHLEPNDTSLVWDRLPMTVAFTSIIAIFIIERVDVRKGTFSIIPLILAGIVSIVYWRRVVTKTSWTDLNPGRRFATCDNYKRIGGCIYFAWIDPPICDRSRQIIPGLLRKINMR